MPQLIAMIIVVVGAMIYMFQTFGGTGDKIEGIAQKTSVITEINNIKNGIKLAAKSDGIDTSSTLENLADLAYFPEQVNDQITETNTDKKYYNAISFGGTDEDVEGNSAMRISLVASPAKMIPGILVEFPSGGSLGGNAGFLESQIANDLKEIAFIDRLGTAPAITSTDTVASMDDSPDTKSSIAKRTPALGDASIDQEGDGKFIIYFKDFASDEVVVAADDDDDATD